jgi:hypothetical protein
MAVEIENDEDIDVPLDDRPEPHELDEDPEQCTGKLLKDPWNDPDQLDWPNAEEETD